MTETQQLARLLALAIYKLGEPLEVSYELLDKMKPVQLVFDPNDTYQVLTVDIRSAEVLIGKVDDNAVEVIL